MFHSMVLNLAAGVHNTRCIVNDWLLGFFLLAFFIRYIALVSGREISTWTLQYFSTHLILEVVPTSNWFELSRR